MFCLFRKYPYICKTNIKHKDYENKYFIDYVRYELVD